MSSTQVCKRCGPTQVYEDNSSHEKVCGNCGAVLEENSLVADVTFGENSSGAAIVQGQFVGNDQTGPVTGGRFGQHSESRLITLEKTKARIFKVAQRLRITEPIALAAVGYFRLALQQNFIKGRKSQYVVSACLYLACRKAGTTHMMMDFAEALYVNVFKIGSTYLQLLKELRIDKLPIVDPSLFIERFTAQLSFGEEGGKRVKADANKLAQRMNRDWLVQGRRPAGVAAACILLAARMNNFRRSKSEIVQVAKIAEETVQRRLDEFKVTSAGYLTVSDFRNTQIETAADPPSYTRHRLKEARDERYYAKGEQEELDEDGNVINKEKNQDEDDEDEDELITEMIRDIDKQANDERIRKLSEPKKEEGEEDDGDVDVDVDEKGQAENEETEKRITDEIDLTLHDPEFKEASKAWQIIRKYRVTKELEEKKMMHQYIKQTEKQKPTPWVSEVRDDPDQLSDVDDEEVDASILTENEVEIKSQIWMSLNRDYLIEQENKRLKMEADIKAGTYKAPRKRKRKAQPQQTKQEGDENAEEPISAAESTKRMLKTAKFSKKINYGAIDNLFGARRKNPATTSTPTKQEDENAE